MSGWVELKLRLLLLSPPFCEAPVDFSTWRSLMTLRGTVRLTGCEMTAPDECETG